MNSGSAAATVTTDEVVARLDDDPTLFLLDVREPDEVSEWAIPGVHNVPLAKLAERLEEIPRDRDVVVICGAGSRARRGAEILAEHGRTSRVMEGGMGAWASTYDTVSEEIAGALVTQVRRRGKGCLSYVVIAGDGAAVIDPSLDVSIYEEVAQRSGARITHVLDTHLHADHISGARELARRSGAALWLNAADPFDFEFEAIRDGARIELDDGVHLSVAAISVPGHTEGSTMYQLGDAAIFTGDTLFLESVGRPDLAEEAEAYAHHLHRSLHQRVLPLGDATRVFPAHYGAGVAVRSGQFVSAPLGTLRDSLPALALDEEAFVTWAIANVRDRPPNYRHVVAINSGREELDDESRHYELGPNRCAIG